MIRRKWIIVPIDKHAERALDYDKASSEELIELGLSEEELDFLYQEGIIDLINQHGNALVDDFEEDEITDTQSLRKVTAALVQQAESLRGSSKYRLIQDLITLFSEALNRDTGVYFFF